MQTAKDILFATFGESAANIRGIDFEPLGSITVDGMAFASTEHGLQWSCGGKVILWLTRGHTVDKRPMAVVYDTTDQDAGNLRRQRAAHKADADRANMTEADWSDYHKPAPHPVLRLAQTG